MAVYMNRDFAKKRILLWTACVPIFILFYDIMNNIMNLSAVKGQFLDADQIRKVDFFNFNYDYDGNIIKLRNGIYKDGTDVTRIIQIEYGDLTGDGVEEAVIVFAWHGGGSGYFTGAEIYQIINNQLKKIYLITDSNNSPSSGLSGGDRGNGGVHHVRILNKTLYVSRHRSDEQNNPYQPAYLETTFYRWNQKYLVFNGRQPLQRLPDLASWKIGNVVFSTYSGKVQQIVQYDVGTEKLKNNDGQTIQGGYPRLSPDGSYLVYTAERRGRWKLFYRIVKTGENREIETGLSQNGYADWAPDGKTIVFAGSLDDSSQHEIYTISIDGSNRRKLTDNSAEDVHPAFSPDGQWIAFASQRDGNRRIYIMRSNGSEVQCVTKDSWYSDYPDWSPDGHNIVYASDRDSNNSSRLDIYARSLKANSVKRLTFDIADERHPAWSPDGKWIAYVALDPEAGNRDIYITDVGGQVSFPLIAAPNDDEHPHWTLPQQIRPRLIFALFTGFGNDRDADSGMRSLLEALTKYYEQKDYRVVGNVFTFYDSQSRTRTALNRPHKDGIEWVKEQSPDDKDKIIVIGHSYGGNRARLFGGELLLHGIRTHALLVIDPIDWDKCGIVASIPLKNCQGCRQNNEFYPPLGNYLPQNVFGFRQTKGVRILGVTYDCLLGYKISRNDKVIDDKFHDEVDDQAAGLYPEYMQALDSTLVGSDNVEAINYLNNRRIENVDFHNFRYYPTLKVQKYYELPHVVAVVKGVYEKNESHVYIANILYSDMTGDGVNESFVTVSYYYNGATSGSDEIHIYSLVNEKIFLLARLSDDDIEKDYNVYYKYNPQTLEGLMWRILSVKVSNGSLIIEREADGPRCCPEQVATMIYQWKDSKLHLRSTPIKRKLLR